MIIGIIINEDNVLGGIIENERRPQALITYIDYCTSYVRNLPYEFTFMSSKTSKDTRGENEKREVREYII